MSAPDYWMDETGGKLRPAVARYLNGADLSADDIALIAAYLRQWIDSPVWDDNPHLQDSGRAELAWLRKGVRQLNTRRGIEVWITLAVDFGVDPL